MNYLSNYEEESMITVKSAKKLIKKAREDEREKWQIELKKWIDKVVILEQKLKETHTQPNVKNGKAKNMDN